MDTLFGEWQGIPLEFPAEFTFCKRVPGRTTKNWWRVSYKGQCIGHVEIVKWVKDKPTGWPKGDPQWRWKQLVPDVIDDTCALDFTEPDGIQGSSWGKVGEPIDDRLNSLLAALFKTGGYPNKMEYNPRSGERIWKTI